MYESPTTDNFVDQYGALRDELPGAGLPWLRDLREDGIARFAELGLPGPSVEAWKSRYSTPSFPRPDKPSSSSQVTRNMMTRSGSVIRSRMRGYLYCGLSFTNGITFSANSRTAWWNSGSASLRRTTHSMKSSMFIPAPDPLV